MTSESIVGVILAAGRGSRMAALADVCPKPLLPICNRPILQFQIDAFREAGIDKVYCVVGHARQAFERAVVTPPGMQIEYVTQVSPLGIAHAVLQMEPVIKGPFLLILGDIFIHPLSFLEMLEIRKSRRAGAVLAARLEDDPEMIRRNFAIVQDEEGRVRRVIEKPKHAPNRLKGCGLYLFDATVFDSIRRTPRTAMRDEYEITDSIQILIEDGEPVHVWSDIVWDMNITNPRDLLLCNLIQLKVRGEKYLLGDRTQLSPGVRLENSVIGSDVQIRGGCLIRNSVILPGSIIAGANDIVNCLAAPEVILYFPDLDVPMGGL